MLRERLIARRIGAHEGNGHSPSVQPEYILQTIGLPWARRDVETWRDQFRKDEALRVFYLANKVTPIADQAELPDWLDRWDLNSAYYTWWRDEQSLLDDVNQLAMEDEARPAFSERDRALASSAAALFQDLGLIPFLREGKLIRRDRMANQVNNPAYPFLQEAADRMNLTPEQYADCLGKYQQLVHLFSPIVKRSWYTFDQNTSTEKEDGDSNAVLRLAEATLNFYWETMAIDPLWTTSRFIGAANQSAFDPEALRFDSKRMETPTYRVHDGEEFELPLKATNDTERETLEKLADAEWWDRVLQHAPNPQVAHMLVLKDVGGYSIDEIANRFAWSPHAVRRNILELRRVLYTDQQLHHPNRERRKGNEPDLFWSELGTDTEKYKKLFLQKKGMLRPFHQNIMGVTLHVATGDRAGTIDAVADYFPHLDRGSVRRHIARSVNLMTHAEPLEALESMRAISSREKEARIMRRLSQDPNFWSSISDKWKRIIEFRYLQPTDLTNVEIGEQVGPHESNVSRGLVRISQYVRRYLNDHPMQTVPSASEDTENRDLAPLSYFTERVNRPHRKQVSRAKEDPNVWESLSPQARTMLELQYLRGSDPELVQKRLAAIFGLDDVEYKHVFQDGLQMAVRSVTGGKGRRQWRNRRYIDSTT